MLQNLSQNFKFEIMLARITLQKIIEFRLCLSFNLSLILDFYENLNRELIHLQVEQKCLNIHHSVFTIKTTDVKNHFSPRKYLKIIPELL